MIMHHKSLWVFIDEPRPDDHCFQLTNAEWHKVLTLPYSQLKPLMHAKNVFGGTII